MREYKYHYNDYTFKFGSAAIVSVDLETTGLDPKKDKICYLSLCFEPSEAWVFSWPMKEGSLGWLMNPKIQKIFHHAKFDIAFLESAGYAVNNFTDTQLMAYHVDNRNCNSDKGKHNTLKILAKKYLGVEEITEFKDLLPIKGVTAGKAILDVPVEKVIPYAGDDAIYTYGLHTVLDPLLEKEVGADESLQIDVQCSTIIKEMMKNGCKIDTTKLLELQSTCINKLSGYEKILSKWLPQTIRVERKKNKELIYEDQPFKLSSNKHLSELLYGIWKLPIAEFTKGGAFSTDAATLKVIEKYHPAIPFLREYKEHLKLQSTYFEPFAERTREDGFLYGGFNQVATITGRLSSSDPNLQNIPVKSELGKELRKCWGSRFFGGKLIVADHSQIEMRVMAHFSQDKALIQAIMEGEDLHTATARAIFSTDEPTPMQRGIGKTINFGTIYGMGAQKLANSLGISLGEAMVYLARYFSTYRGVKDYMYSQQSFAEQNGYVTTLLGRKLYIHEYDYSGTRAVNYPIQGSAAEIIKIGMINMAKFICSQGNRAKLILQVHDELVIDCPPEDVAVYERNTEEVMLEDIPKLKVPLKVDVKIVDSWGNAKD